MFQGTYFAIQYLSNYTVFAILTLCQALCSPKLLQVMRFYFKTGIVLVLVGKVFSSCIFWTIKTRNRELARGKKGLSEHHSSEREINRYPRKIQPQVFPESLGTWIFRQARGKEKWESTPPKFQGRTLERATPVSLRSSNLSVLSIDRTAMASFRRVKIIRTNWWQWHHQGKGFSAAIAHASPPVYGHVETIKRDR